MADQCIICLEDLDSSPEIIQNSPGHCFEDHITVSAATISNPGPVDNQQLVAAIQPCGHILHNDCAREWSQKANSCPICRQAFNLVHVHDKVGGVILSTYTVENKKQVAEFDVNAWIDDQIEEEESSPCPICNSAENEEILLLCDGCEANYHTHCTGLEDVPHGNWYCMECKDKGFHTPADRTRPLRPARQPRLSTQRTQAQARRSRNRARNDAWQGAWSQISGRVWDALNLDLDYEDDDNSLAAYRRHQSRIGRERTGRQQWAQRVNIAERQGARDVFRNATRPLLSEAEQKQSKEEQKAWDAFEKAREGNASGMSSRKRKSGSRSATQSPREQASEPERKRKRPRTRRVVDKPGSSSDGQADSMLNSSTPREPAGRPVAAPSFLSSLLKEVEMSSSTDDEGVQILPLSTTATSPSAEHSSPMLSPATSNYSTPRAMSLTPPPHGPRRPGSPIPLTSHVEPVFPPADYSPSRSPPDYSLKDEADSPPRVNDELRQPRPRRRQQRLLQLNDISPTRATIPQYLDSRSRNSSPNQGSLSREAKEDINRIVRSALDPHYKKPAGITKEQYSYINRLVSRMLYDKINDSGTLDDRVKSAWEQIASAEVAKAVQGLTA